MDYLWTCQDIFENRNEIFKIASHSDKSPSTDSSPPGTSDGSFNNRSGSCGEFSWGSSPSTNEGANYPWGTRERTPSSSSDSSSSFSESENFQRPLEPMFRKIGPNYCSFCKTNGEIKEVYGSHCLKTLVSNKFVVECPVLRRLKCKICGATGDDAHTITHCPQGSVVVPIAKELKSNATQKH